MRYKKDEFEDDGRVIADMSEVGHPSFLSSLKKLNQERKENGDDSFSMTRKEAIWAVLGTLKASFLIAAVYAVVFFVVILLMYLYFRSKLQ